MIDPILLNNQLPADSKLKVGVLGGSFNPAHIGHIHISDEAIRLLGLDYVLWLVSPQNPMKTENIRDGLGQRVEYARRLVHGHNIIVTDLEKNLPTNYTKNTLEFLLNQYPQIHFIWIMGADNMAQVHKWYCWKEIFDMVFVAVFDREGYTQKAIKSEAAKVYKDFLITSDPLLDQKKYSWCFFYVKKYDISSSIIRNAMMKMKFDMKNLVMSVLEENKAEDIKIIDLRDKAYFADFMIISSGRSSKHVCSIAEKVMGALKKEDISPVSAFGLELGEWVLIDAGRIIINVFVPESRQLYNLEELWDK